MARQPLCLLHSLLFVLKLVCLGADSPVGRARNSKDSETRRASDALVESDGSIEDGATRHCV